MSDNNMKQMFRRVFSERRSRKPMDTGIQLPVDCDSWCRTRDGEDDDTRYKFVWTIQRFSQRPEKNSESLDSDIFTIQGPGSMKTQWTIRLYPKGAKNEASNWLSVYLCNETETEVNAGYEFSILDSKKANRSSFKAIKQFASKTSSKSNKGWGMEKMIEIRSLQSQSSQLLPTDSLTIVCNVQ